ncbi:MAG TPA: inositol monophosphatase family protein [Acidimicrobiales bacterium]
MAGRPDPIQLVGLAERVARAAGRLLVAARADAVVTATTKSTATDMVSAADHDSEAYIAGALAEARPSDGLLAEEGSERPTHSGVVWVVDPLDGTTNYLYDHRGWNVSIAATVDGQPVASAVYDPTVDEMFTAALGHGSRLNGSLLRIGPPPPLATALVGTGFGYDPERRRHQANVLAKVLPCLRDIRRGGAAAIDLCWVAAGRLDAFYEGGLAQWDIAGGRLVATEAGASVTGPGGRRPSSDLVVAAGEPLVGHLAALVVAAGALDGP